MGFENSKKSKEGELPTQSEKVLVATVAAGVLAAGVTLGVEEYIGENPEYIKESVMDLGEKLNEKFKTRLQVETVNGQYILHIGQIHGVDGKTSSDWQEKVIERQKDIEELILELKKRYGVSVYFAEGKYTEQENDSLHTFDLTLSDYKKWNHSAYMKDRLWPALRQIEGTIKKFSSEDFESVDELGLTSPQTKRRHYVENYRALSRFSELMSYIVNQDSISDLEKEEGLTAIARIESLQALAAATPGFHELEYIVGGATEKLDHEGLIQENPAETYEVIANRPRTRFQTFGVGARFHEKREDFSARLAYEYAINNPETKYVPVVYGYRHDFTNNVQAINEAQTDPNYKVGLIRIDPK
jgi:hypothetical protein